MSKHNNHPVKLGELLSLTTEDGPFLLHNGLLHLDYSGINDVEIEARITFEGNESDWDAIQARQLFGVKKDNIGPIWGGQFKPDKILIFELLQVTTTTTFLGIITEHPLEAAIQLVEAKANEEFRQESAYQLVAVKQEILPGVFAGLKIHHPVAKPPSEGEIESLESISRKLQTSEIQNAMISDFESLMKAPKP